MTTSSLAKICWSRSPVPDLEVDVLHDVVLVAQPLHVVAEARPAPGADGFAKKHHAPVKSLARTQGLTSREDMGKMDKKYDKWKIEPKKANERPQIGF